MDWRVKKNLKSLELNYSVLEMIQAMGIFVVLAVIVAAVAVVDALYEKEGCNIFLSFYLSMGRM